MLLCAAQSLCLFEAADLSKSTKMSKFVLHMVHPRRHGIKEESTISSGPSIKGTKSGLREEGTTHRQGGTGCTASNLADGKSACFVHSFWLMTAEPIKEEGRGCLRMLRKKFQTTFTSPLQLASSGRRRRNEIKAGQ